MIDICFGIDVMVNFRTTYINIQTGDEVSEAKAIAYEYLKSKLWIDLLASIPFD